MSKPCPRLENQKTCRKIFIRALTRKKFFTGQSMPENTNLMKQNAACPKPAPFPNNAESMPDPQKTLG